VPASGLRASRGQEEARPGGEASEAAAKATCRTPCDARGAEVRLDRTLRRRMVSLNRNASSTTGGRRRRAIATTRETRSAGSRAPRPLRLRVGVVLGGDSLQPRAGPGTVVAVSPYVPVHISDSDVAKLSEEVEFSDARVKRYAELRLGDKSRWWPCPRCPEAEARETHFVRRIELTVDHERGVVVPEDKTEADGVLADLKRGYSFTSFLQDVPSGLLDLAVGRLGPAALVYHCPRHGEFQMAETLGEIHGWKTFVIRDGILVEANFRYHFCAGLIETVGADGDRVEVERCDVILEAHGDGMETGVGECFYVCPIHGTQTCGSDGSLEGCEQPVVRRID
jgi:hypothetical protein